MLRFPFQKLITFLKKGKEHLRETNLFDRIKIEYSKVYQVPEEQLDSQCSYDES